MEKPSVNQICIHIVNQHSRCRMTFNLPESISQNTPWSNVRKIVRYMLKYAHQDETIIPILDSWFDYMIEREKDLWTMASHIYQQQFRLPENGKTKKEQRQIRANNKRMYGEVVRCKAAYEKSVDRKSKYEEIKGN